MRCLSNNEIYIRNKRNMTLVNDIEIVATQCIQRGD